MYQDKYKVKYLRGDTTVMERKQKQGEGSSGWSAWEAKHQGVKGTADGCRSPQGLQGSARPADDAPSRA